MKYTYFFATLRACLASIRSQDSPFSIVTRLRATHRGIIFRFVPQARDFSLLQSNQTDYDAALASYSMITRVKPTTHLQQVSRLRMSRAVPQQPHTPSWRAQNIFTFGLNNNTRWKQLSYYRNRYGVGKPITYSCMGGLCCKPSHTHTPDFVTVFSKQFELVAF